MLEVRLVFTADKSEATFVFVVVNLEVRLVFTADKLEVRIVSNIDNLLVTYSIFTICNFSKVFLGVETVGTPGR